MEEKKTFFDYMGQVFMIFGFTMVILNLFCRLFGESAKGYSGMFVLGKEGVAVDKMTAANPKATYACINTKEAYAPEEIKDRPLCIQADIAEVLKQL